MKLTLLKNNISRITFILGLAVVLLWACGESEPKDEGTETIVVPDVSTDTTATDTTEVDTTVVPKDPVPIKTPETPE